MTESRPLFILEMANNHMGDVAHGVRLIEAFREVCEPFDFDFGFKLQYRDLDTYLHPDALGTDLHYVKRFNDTRLTHDERLQLVTAIRDNGFRAICTPFDNASVPEVVNDGFEVLKIASCSFSDWPLLEEIATTSLPIIASTAGATLEELDAVVSFLTHRDKSFILMHCVAEYPMSPDIAQLNQIDFIRHRYPGVNVGFSTHEPPDDATLVQLAIAKGARVFEKHVALPTDEYAVNAYSSTPDQVRQWLSKAEAAFRICGTGGGRHDATQAEKDSLFSLRRGVFANRDLTSGETVTDADVFMAFPCEPGQVTANEWSKYRTYQLTADLDEGGAVTTANTCMTDVRSNVWEIVEQVRAMLEGSNVVLPGQADLEISHHYGIENFFETGITMITVINRDYCKKLILVLPGQHHPEQYHQQKEETFMVLKGDLALTLDGETRNCTVGDVITIDPGVRHAFTSTTGAIIEELSTTHFADDSFYTDEKIMQNPNRKTQLTYWM